MKTKCYAFFFSLFFGFSLHAQDRFDVRVIENTRSDMGLSYNFLVGDNTDDFRTTIKGFGSGFLFDFLSGRFSKDVIWMGTDNVNLTLGVGANVAKYRFSEPLVFFEEGGQHQYSRDLDPTHSYGEGFFSGDKSKLVIASVVFPANVNFDLGKFYASAGATFDVYAFAKQKNKYTVDGDRKKEVLKNDTMNDFPFNKTKWGLSAMMLHKNSGLSMGITYMLTPMFKEDSLFPEMREVRVSFAYDLSMFDKD